MSDRPSTKYPYLYLIMNENVKKLVAIAEKEQRLIVGLMSGTSMDGLDIALCRINGGGRACKLDVVHFTTMVYEQAFRSRVREVFAKRTIDHQALCGLHALIGQTHGELVNAALHTWEVTAEEIDLIASHGQTVYHAPQSLTGIADYPNSTLQLGDGDHVAIKTGIITVSDFRQKHVAAGGEGGPLAAYGDYLLFAHEQETRILLNIGGIANFTFLPATSRGASCFATDVGPGNTLMDHYMQARLGKEMDESGALAATGAVHHKLLETLMAADFFAQPFPKTTGPELFNLEYLAVAQRATDTQQLPDRDVMATLCAFSAKAIVRAVRQVIEGDDSARLYVSGGGLHNPTLMNHIGEGLSQIPVSSFGRLGLLPDAKEAALFALLANETVVGDAAHLRAIRDAPAVCMGKISFPT